MPRHLAGLAGVAASLAISTAALAQSAADTLAQAGMLGRWARDCSQSSRLTPHIFYERVSGGTGAQYRMDYVGTSIVMMIDNVRKLTPNSLALRIKTPPGDKDPESHDLVIVIERDRSRAMSSVNSEGKVHIRDGILVASGQPSPWEHRCAD